MKIHCNYHHFAFKTTSLVVVALNLLGFIIVSGMHIEKDGKLMKPARFDVRANDNPTYGVPDLIFSSNPGLEVCIFKNEQGKKPEGEITPGMGKNYTLY